MPLLGWYRQWYTRLPATSNDNVDENDTKSDDGIAPVSTLPASIVPGSTFASYSHSGCLFQIGSLALLIVSASMNVAFGLLLLRASTSADPRKTPTQPPPRNVPLLNISDLEANADN